MDEVVVLAPAGDLGLHLASTFAGPTVDRVAADSPLQLDVDTGWKLIQIDGVPCKRLSCHAAAALMQRHASRPRELRFSDPTMSMKIATGTAAAAALDTGGVVFVDAPPGRLGVLLANAPGGGAFVIDIRPASPLAKRVRIGWRLQSVDGRDVSMLDYREAAQVLSTSASRTRTLAFDTSALRRERRRWQRTRLLMRIIHMLGPALLFVAIVYQKFDSVVGLWQVTVMSALI